jgi:hypothetical protein
VTNSNTEDLASIGPLFQKAAAGIKAIDPPSKIASDWSTFGNGLQQLGDLAAKTDFNDPQQATNFQASATQIESEFSTAATNVDNYLTTECGIDTGSTDSASPTS